MFTPRLLKLKIHSQRVSVFKRLLPICAFLLTSVMIAWPALKEQKDTFTVAVPSKNTLKDAQNDMEQVRFFSKDNNQNPFTVVAESVRETDPARQIVLMEKPTATYRMKNNTILTGMTPFGMAFQQEHYLYFEEPVDITSTDGYQGLSSKVICEYEKGRLGSDSDIFVKGPAGMLTAQGFFVKDNGDYIHFKNHTESLLFHIPKNISEIDSLQYTAMRDYLKQNEQNIFITSDNGLIINQAQQTITALKNVNITQGNGLLTAPEVILTYQKRKNGETVITKLQAENKVHITKPNQKATAQKLTVYKDSNEINIYLQEQTSFPELKTTQNIGQIIVLSGQAVLQDKENSLKAEYITAIYESTGNKIEKVIADQNVIAVQQDKMLSGNRLTIYQNPEEIQTVLKTLPAIKELNTAQAPGQIIVIDGNAEAYEKPNKLSADKLYVFYDSKGEKIEKSVAVGNMVAQNETQKIQGEYGVYTTATEVASVYKNVILSEKDSVLKGSYASLNMKTGISSLTTPKQKNGQKGRVKGSIVPNNFKGE